MGARKGTAGGALLLPHDVAERGGREELADLVLHGRDYLAAEAGVVPGEVREPERAHHGVGHVPEHPVAVRVVAEHPVGAGQRPVPAP